MPNSLSGRSRGRFALFSVGACLCLALLDVRTAAAQAVRIDTIKPAAAYRGDTVTITGYGFAAFNVVLEVGGVKGQVLSANGNTVKFQVPGNAPFGATTVRAINPGGRSGAIPFDVLGFDGTVAIVVDESRKAAAPIGAEGGEVSTTAADGSVLRLTVPAGAVPEGKTITLTPLTALVGSPFSGTPVGVRMEPSGLVLLKPATLTLPLPAGAPSGLLVTFGFNGDGAGLHLVPHVSLPESVSILVWHFSGAGAVIISAAQLEAVLGYLPTPAHELAEQRIAAALAQPLSPEDREVLVFNALRDWYQRSVRTGLQVADSGPLGFFELAFGEWQAWLADAALYSTSSWTQQENEAFSLALQAAGQHARALLPRCTAAGTPIPAFRNVIRLASAVNLAELPLDQLLGTDGQPLPSGSNLATACMRVEVIALLHANTFARNRDHRVTADATVAFYDGTSDNTIELRFRLDDVTNGPPVAIATDTSANGHWEATVRPTTLGQRSYDLTVALAAAATDDTLKALRAGSTFNLPVRERLELHARRAGDPNFTDMIGSVTTGAAVFLRVRLAGDNINAVTITLTHDGNGTLPATATTNTAGEALVTYSAPTSAEIELVTATVTDSGLTTGDAVVITTVAPVLVTVSPATATLQPGQTRQFTATVTGTTITTVTWFATGGTITNAGLYTAGTTLGDFSVIARAATTPTVVGGAAVTILAPASVEGRYVGTVCRINDDGSEGCGPGFIVQYQCNFFSNLHPGTTCGWFSGQSGDQVPQTIPLCLIETDGTTAGGAFQGTVTFCRFRPASNYSSTRIEGTIGSGSLEIRVYAPGFDGIIRLWERISMTKVF